MKSQVILSVAALSIFPVVGYAQINAVPGTAQTAKKSAAVTITKELAPGKYKLVSNAITGGKLKVTISGKASVSAKEFDAGKKVDVAFEVTSKGNVTFTFTTTANEVKFTPSVDLLFDFAKVVEQLKIPYNELTSKLAVYGNAKKNEDIKTAEGFYSRIVAINEADYKFYVADSEGLQAIYKDESDVSGLKLNTEIVSLISTSKASEESYLGNSGDGLIKALNDRYDALRSVFVTKALTTAKDAAATAYTTWVISGSVDDHTALLDAIEAYKKVLEPQENAQKACEDANTTLTKNLDDVYGAKESYYTQMLKAIDTEYAQEDGRYNDLKGELKSALSALVSGDGSSYSTVKASVQDAYNNGESSTKQEDLQVAIDEFKGLISKAVADYNEKLEVLVAAYTTYDEQKAAADALTKDHKSYLDAQVADIDDALAALKLFIEYNDIFNNIANLEGDKFAGYVAAIANAEEKFKAEKALYVDYENASGVLTAKTKALTDAGTAIDKYAKDTKKVTEFKPTTGPWKADIDAIKARIAAQQTLLDNNKKGAGKTAGGEAYTKENTAIDEAIKALKTNANEATDLFVGIQAAAKTIGDNTNTVNKIEGLTTLNVYKHQVTTDEAIKARTPYGTVITEAGAEKADMEATLTAAAAKRGKYAEKDANNILVYLQNQKATFDNTPDYAALLDQIAKNYQNDEKAFLAEQNAMEINGLILVIKNKIEEYNTKIDELTGKESVDAMGSVRTAALKEYLKAKIDPLIAEANAATEKAGVTRDELKTVFDNLTKKCDGYFDEAATKAATYKTEYADFVATYKALEGETTDASLKNTYNGLMKLIAEKQKAVDDSKFLSASQKTTLKDNIAGTKATSGKKYNAAGVKNILDKALESENKNDLKDLSATEISNVKTAINKYYNGHITNLNTLEEQLQECSAAIETEKAEILKADSNKDGYYYKQLISTDQTKGYTGQYNKLKSDIEKDTDLNNTDKSSYTSKINALKGNITASNTKADNCKKGYDAANKELTETTQSTLDDALKELANYPSSKLEEQMTTLRGYQDKIDAQATANTKAYNDGTTDWNTINNTITALTKSIQDYLELCIGAHYDAQIAADNLANFNAIGDAEKGAKEAYDAASAVINGYKYLKSEELINATEQAEAEKAALLAVMDQALSDMEKIRNKADEAYLATVSPKAFDQDGAIKAEMEAVIDAINAAKEAFLNKINANLQAAEASIKNYTDAVAASKASFKTLSANDKEVAITGQYDGVDAMIEALNEAWEAKNLQTLDDALVAAAHKKTGVEASVRSIEIAQAQASLKTLLSSAFDYYSYLNWGDYNRLLILQDDIYLGKPYIVTDFASIKAELKELRERGYQQMIESGDKLKSEVANAQTALDNHAQYADDFAAYVDVESDFDASYAELEEILATGVTVETFEKVIARVQEIAAANAIQVKLFEKECAAIEKLISQANEELTTYKSTATEAQFVDAQGKINSESESLLVVKKAAVKDADKIGQLPNLKTIENHLNAVLKIMRAANGTDKSAAIAGELTGKLNTLDNQVNAKHKTYVLKDYDQEVKDQVNEEVVAIQNAIADAQSYVSGKAANMMTYKANAERMISDIEAAIEQLKIKAQELQDKKDADDAEKAAQAVAQTWQNCQNAIDVAKAAITFMNGELEAYGTANKYSNKISALNTSVATAEKILADAKAEGADKQYVADQALIDVQAALTNVAANADNITYLAKTAYIDAFIAKLKAKLDAVTWDKDNYTTPDQNTLDDMKEAIQDNIDSYRTEAVSQAHAKPYETWYSYEPGVIGSLNNNEEYFNADIDKLKKFIRENSLVGDTRGHITGGDKVTDDDIQTLAEKIANGLEGDLNQEAADCNKDGKVTVTDIIWLQYFWAFNEWPDGTAAARMMGDSAEGGNTISVKTVSATADVTRIAINLDNATDFRAFQIGLQLPAGAKVVGQSFGERVVSGYLMHSDVNEGFVRFMTIADSSKPFAGNEGAVLYVDIEGLNNGTVTMSEAYFTDVNFNEADLLAVGETTGITQRISNALQNAGQKVYNMGGRVMDSLKKGINIIRNADGSSKKVIKK